MKVNDGGFAARGPRLTLRIAGPRVGEARLSASDLAEIVKRTQQALQRVGQVLYGEESRGRGRKRKDIEDLCELFLVGWQRGSAVAEFELAPPPAQESLFGYIGEESLKAFVGGMEKLAAGAASRRDLPKGFDMGVLQTCDYLGRTLQHGIHSISYLAENRGVAQEVSYDDSVHERVRNLLSEPAEADLLTKVGRLEILSGHRGLTGRLWEPDGTGWLCQFSAEHMDQLPEAWMHTVRVVGRREVAKGQANRLEVKSIAVMDEGEAGELLEGEGVLFWRSSSLEDLAAEQDVSPAEQLDELSALWPEDDDPDQLLRHILKARRERREESR